MYITSCHPNKVIQKIHCHKNSAFDLLSQQHDEDEARDEDEEPGIDLSVVQKQALFKTKL